LISIDHSSSQKSPRVRNEVRLHYKLDLLATSWERAKCPAAKCKHACKHDMRTKIFPNAAVVLKLAFAERNANNIRHTSQQLLLLCSSSTAETYCGDKSIAVVWDLKVRFATHACKLACSTCFDAAHSHKSATQPQLELAVAIAAGCTCTCKLFATSYCLPCARSFRVAVGLEHGGLDLLRVCRCLMGRGKAGGCKEVYGTGRGSKID
jgi:hypothetical protein